MEEENKKGESYDVIVIGAGVAGLSAAMYAARLELKTLCLGHSNGSELPLGGVITTTNIVENYPGFISLSGPELANKIKTHTENYKLATLKQEEAKDEQNQPTIKPKQTNSRTKDQPNQNTDALLPTRRPGWCCASAAS